MTLDTLGHQIDNLNDFVANFNVRRNGMTFPEMAMDLQELGISSRRTRLSLNDIKIESRFGKPIVIGVGHPEPGGPGHAIVDGITTRYGRRVVVVRDPHGRQYFEDLENT